MTVLTVQSVVVAARALAIGNPGCGVIGRYFHSSGEAGCLVGGVLAAHGITYETLKENSHKCICGESNDCLNRAGIGLLHRIGVLKADFRTLTMLIELQRLNDMGCPWGAIMGYVLQTYGCEDILAVEPKETPKPVQTDDDVEIEDYIIASEPKPKEETKPVEEQVKDIFASYSNGDEIKPISAVKTITVGKIKHVAIEPLSASFYSIGSSKTEAQDLVSA